MQMEMQEALTNPDELKEIIERGKRMETSKELVTLSGEVIESEPGILHDVEMEGETVTLFVPESVEGQG